MSVLICSQEIGVYARANNANFLKEKAQLNKNGRLNSIFRSELSVIFDYCLNLKKILK